jgi:hypothetical protein
LASPAQPLALLIFFLECSFDLPKFVLVVIEALGVLGYLEALVEILGLEDVGTHICGFDFADILAV